MKQRQLKTAPKSPESKWRLDWVDAEKRQCVDIYGKRDMKGIAFALWDTAEQIVAQFVP